MRLRCRVKVGCEGGRPGLGSVAVGKGADGLPRLLLRTAADQADRRYKLRANVKRFHDSHVAAGKLSVVFERPAVTVFLSEADGSQLALLAKLLRRSAEERPCEAGDGEGPSTALPLRPLQPTKARHLVPKLQKLTATGRKEFREKLARAPRKAFAAGGELSELLQLRVLDAELRSVERVWASLSRLSVLELSGNLFGVDGLRGLDFARLPCLAELRLPNNQLEALDETQFSQLSARLSYLDLSANRLRSLPDSLRRLKALRCLLVQENSLTALPVWLGSALVCLQTLRVSDNPLSHLPASARRLHLHSVDASGTAVTSEEELVRGLEPAEPGHVPSLLELAGKVVRDGSQGADLSDRLPPSLRSELASFGECEECWRSLLPTAAVAAKRPLDLRLVSQSIVHDPNVGARALLKGRFCGTKCAQRFLGTSA